MSHIYCSSCDSCQNCVSCQECNSCQSCDAGCNSIGCNTIQAFCSTTGQTYGLYAGFNFSYPPIAGNIMGPGYFDQSVWDEIITYINTMRSKGSFENSGDPISYSDYSNIAPFSAKEFNRISSYAGGPTVTSGSVIEGAYFQNLASSVVLQQLSASACDQCNAKCNVTCDECQKCNTSNTDQCPSYQTCTIGNTSTVCCKCVVYCQSCNTCQSCNVCDNCQIAGELCGSCELDCQSCDSCQNCDTCQSCNVCNTCQTACEIACQITGELCGNCELGCQSCDSCQSCNVGEQDICLKNVVEDFG